MMIVKFSEIAGKSGSVRERSIEWLEKQFKIVYRGPSFFIVEGSGFERIPGISEFGEVVEARAEIEEIKRKAVDFLKKKRKEGEICDRFYLKVRRRGIHDFTSLDIAREVGKEIEKNGFRVDFERGREVGIEISGDNVFIYLPKRGLGGIAPVISRAVTLVSGSPESILAHYLVQAHGFTSIPVVLYTQRKPELSFDAFFVDMSELMEELTFARPGFDGLLFKYSLYKIGKELANKFNGIFVTGEIIGKNLANDPSLIAKVENASGAVPYRPLGFLSRKEVREKIKEMGIKGDKLEFRFKYIHASSRRIEDEAKNLSLDLIIKRMVEKI